MTRRGHPLPASGEARHNEIPEGTEAAKGVGDDPAAIVQPEGDPVTPDGEAYRYADLGRGPGSRPRRGDEESSGSGQAAHQDRGQGVAEEEDR